MSIANLANIPSDDTALLNWSFAHMDHHRRINAAIQAQQNKKLQLFSLDPINAMNFSEFLYQHSVMHGEFTGVLKIVTGFNLLDVKWEDEAQRATWIFQNFTEHRQASQQLGIG